MCMHVVRGFRFPKPFLLLNPQLILMSLRRQSSLLRRSFNSNPNSSMKPLLPKPTNFTNPENPIIKFRHFSTSPTHFHSSSYGSRRHEDESRLVRVSVWWDFENCQLPAKGGYAYRVAQSITSAVRANGIKGPIQITAFGDVMQLSRATQEMLSSTGINITHVPNGGKNSADRSLLVDLMYWVSQNPPPAHLFLISGDRDFANILHRLRLSNYNILLSSPDSAPGVLCSAASIMWQWNALVRGEDLNGKHFNQPPDGPYGSWYGHYKLPLEDPFAVTEQFACSRSGDSSDSGSELNTRPVPREVVKQIQCILKLFPHGISITELRQELFNSDVSLDKDLYGYKKFSKFLSSMPQILKSQHLGDGQYYIQSVAAKFPDSDEDTPSITSGHVTNSGDRNKTISIKRSGGDSLGAGTEERSLLPSPKVHARGPSKNLPESSNQFRESFNKVPDPSSEKANKADVYIDPFRRSPESLKPDGSFFAPTDEKLSVPPSPKVHVREPLKKLSATTNQLKEPFKEVPDPSPEKANNAEDHVDPLRELSESQKHVEDASKKVPGDNLVVKMVNNEVTESYPSASKEQDPVSKVGFFTRIWRKVVGTKDNSSIENTSEKPDNHATSGDSPMKTKEPENSCAESTGAFINPVGRAQSVSSNDKSVIDDNIAGNCEADGGSIRRSGLLSRIIERCKFWNTQKLNSSTELSTDKGNLIMGDDSGKNPIFSKESFWNEMFTFIDTPRGSDMVKRSMNRVELAHNLQKEGPSVLGDLIESDLLHLADMLILDKKWVEECLSEKYPFKLIRPSNKDSSSSNPNCNGLSSIFLDTQSLPESQSLQEHKKKGHQNLPNAQVSPSQTSMNLDKSRTEVVADCRKLLEFIVLNYPEGFSIGKFRKLFLDKYGYSLDVHKFGYKKLVSLVQMMPEVKLESAYIKPAAPFGRDLKSSAIKVTDPSVPTINVNDAKSNFGGNMSDTSGMTDQLDSSWEELGPITHTTKRNEIVSSRRKIKETVGQVNHRYETLSDDCLSESDEESLFPDVSKNSRKKEDSSLLQILDSWYQNKEDDTSSSKDSTRVAPDIIDVVTDCFERGLVSSLSKGSLQNEAQVGLYEQKRRPSKSYSFVSDDTGDDKDKLIDGILGSLKKSGKHSDESGVQA